MQLCAHEASKCDLILVRHLSTDMAGRFCGHSDPPLNEAGRGQLCALKEKLHEYQITHVFSSDFKRAVETAYPVGCMAKCELRVLASLREIDFGLWEGLEWSEVAQRYPQHAQAWLDSFPTVAAPEGEQFDSFRRRVRSAMDLIAAEIGDGCAVVITHGGVIRTFIWDILKLSTKEYQLVDCDYGSFYHVYRRGEQRGVADADLVSVSKGKRES